MTTKAGSAFKFVLATSLALGLPLWGQAPAAGKPSPAEVLMQRASALDSQGRHDLAAEIWSQVLTIKPNDPHALAALAAYYRSVGDTATAKRYTNQLRLTDPGDSHMGQVQAAYADSNSDVTLKEAARLASQHRYTEALALYRKAFHETTPTGNWAVAYYETEAAVPSEMNEAVAGLRSLVKQYPTETSYALSLGRVLTYRPETRLEGVRILQNIKGTAAQMNAAREAWRQALLWDPSGPAALETGEQYVARFDDQAVMQALQSAPARQPKRIAVEGESELGDAFALLDKGRLDEAEKAFTELTKIQPQRAKAFLGLGYVAMQRQQFDAALEKYELARHAGLHTTELNDAMREARFWGSVQKGEQALTAQNASEALTHFQYASELRPNNPAVLDALGRAWMQMNRPEKALPFFEQAVKLNEDQPEGWINWFGALAQTGHGAEVVADQQYMPAVVSNRLASDPEYIAIVAVCELQTGDEQSYRRMLEQLHNATDTTKRIAGQMRVASLLLSTQPRDAAREALEVIRLAPDNLQAWKLVVIGEHLANRDYMAQTAIERMPQQLYAAAAKDTGFAITLAAVQQSIHHYGEAADVLESARARAGDDPVALRTIDSQLAALALDQGHPDKAAQQYSAILQEQPNNSDAWAGLLSALHQSGQDRLARGQMDMMPPSVLDHLQRDPGYLQVAAAIYTETHEQQRALNALAIARNYYRDRQIQIPYSVEAQRAWALIAAGDDNSVATTLVQLSHRSNLTAAEQLQNRKLWAAWSVRKALRAEKQGNPQQALAILQMASQAYPDSVDIRRALAGTYVRTGNAKAALALYGAIDWYSAEKQDFLGAISAASAARDFSEGRQWLANALQRFPDDPQVLTAGAEFESSAGDVRKAKEYWQAVLNIPEQKLEQQLTQAPNGATSISASEALARMLAPHVNAEGDGTTGSSVSSPAVSRGQDEVSAMLPEYVGDSESRAITPTANLDAPAPPADASPWLVQKAQSGTQPPTSAASKSNYHPMAYSPVPADSADGFSSTDSRLSAPAYEQTSQQDKYQPVIGQPISGDSAGAKVDDNTPRNPEHAAAVPRLALVSQQNRPGSVSGPGWSSSESSNVTPDTQEQTLLEPSTTTAGDPSRSLMIQSNPEVRRASEELQNISSQLSPWGGGEVRIVGRSGSPGFDRLTRSEIGIEGSFVLGASVRVTGISKPVFLTSGTPVANANGVLDTAYNFGQSGAPLLNSPHYQSGVGGELQLATRFLDGELGFTPSSFYVSNVTGSVQLHPEHTPFRLGLFRESIAETMLSYAGERDPVTGAIWGGVVATGADGGLSKGNEDSGFYMDFSAAKITGRNVNDNNRLHGSTGAYWTFYRNAFGSLKIGANMTGEHFAQNQRYFTYGQGGYFSPDTYLLINAPFTWKGRSNRLTYTVSGSLGMQSFNEGPALPGSISTNTPTAQTVIGANYNLAGNFAYKLDEHWYVGTFFDVNNASNYQERTVGFSVHYMTLPQVQSLVGPTGLFDPQAYRPLIIP